MFNTYELEKSFTRNTRKYDWVVEVENLSNYEQFTHSESTSLHLQIIKSVWARELPELHE